MTAIKPPEVMAFIPARGGSRGIPKKNIRPLAGYPLIAYSILDALQAKSVTRIVVSTDCTEIANVATQAGADVPFLRPQELAGDKSLVGDALDYTINRLAEEEGYRPDIVVNIYPTSPFRPEGLVDTLVEKALCGQSPASTYKRIPFSADRYFYECEGTARPVMNGTPDRSAFRSYGLCAAQRVGGSGTPFIYVIDDPLYYIDIDTEEDMSLAEIAIREGLYTPRFDEREGPRNA